MIQVLNFTQIGCPPCVTLKPYIDALAANTPAEVLNIDVRSEGSQEIIQTYQAFFTPSVIILVDGHPVTELLDGQNLLDMASSGALENIVNSHVAGPPQPPTTIPNTPTSTSGVSTGTLIGGFLLIAGFLFFKA